MYSGDGKNGVEKVRRELIKLKYCSKVKYDLLLKGNHEVFIGLYRFILCDYSRKLHKHFLDMGYEMTGMPDRKFMETVYRLMRDVFDVKPSVTQAQFFSSGFAERKMEMLTNISAIARKLHLKVCKPDVQKCAISCNVMNPKTVHSEKEPEIIEINASRRVFTKCRIPLDNFPPNSQDIQRPYKCSSSNEKNYAQMETNEKKPVNNVSTYQVIPCNEVTGKIPLSVIDASLTDSQRQSESETQTCGKTDFLLENISTKLENITARLTILETRMSHIEEKTSSEALNETNNGRNLKGRLKTSTQDVSLSTHINEREKFPHDLHIPRNFVKPVEAVVVNLSNQSHPINEHSVKFCDFPQNEWSRGSETLCGPPRHYSPTLYRLNSNDAVNENTSGEDVGLSSEDDIDQSQILSSRVTRSLQNKHSQPLLNLKTDEDQRDQFQSQISRIQEMIQKTNVMLNPSADPTSVL